MHSWLTHREVLRGGRSAVAISGRISLDAWASGSSLERYLDGQQLAISGRRNLDFGGFGDAQTITATEALASDLGSALEDEHINTIFVSVEAVAFPLPRAEVS